MADTSWLPLSFPSRTAALCIHHVTVAFPKYPCNSNGMLPLNNYRYNCQKCGCSGDTKEANYRYRLSLEVADTHDIFEVTVFGSCLDTYFGATAKGLQRYIEELNREAGEDEKDAMLGAVFHAVETCFVGKKFVFRIKSSEKANVASLLQNGCQRERSTKALIACEMFVPHPGLVGYTVIFYIEQQRSSQFEQSHGALWPPDHVLASDHPSSELKSLHLSGDLDVTQSSHRNGFFNLWPYSFGLTWSSTSSEEAEHSAALDARKSSSEKEKGEDGSIMSASQLVYNFRAQNSTQDKGVVHEGEKSCWYPSPQSLTTKDKVGRRPSIKGKNGDSLESPLASEQKDSSCKIGIQSSCGLANPRHPLPHQRPKEHLSSSSSPGATGGVTSQEASSGGLIEFLAKLANGKSPADLPNGQEQRPASVLCEKSGGNKENELFAEEQDCSWGGRDVYHFPQVGSSCPEANFDASSDLFEISARGSTKSTTATLHRPQIVTPRTGALTPNFITSELMPREGKGNASWTTTYYGLLFYDTMDVSVPKTSTPIVGSGFKSECSPLGTLDFTPDPRSIPLARPCHPDSLSSGKGSLLSELPLNKLPWDKDKCKRSRLPLKNSLVKQLVSKFSLSARSSDAEAGTDNPWGPLSRLSAQEPLSKDDGQEWSPPSGKIQGQDVKPWRRKRRKSFIRFHSDGRVTEDFPLSENQGGSSSPRNLSKLAEVAFLPKKQQPEEADIEGQRMCQQRTMLSPPVNESPDRPPSVDFSRSKLLPTPPPVTHVADWSSELFSGHDQLSNVEATISQPTS